MCKNCDKSDKTVKCELCHKARYCSEQCANLDWEHHQLKCNVHQVSAVGDTVFVPYCGEDMLEDRDLENVSDDHMLCQQHLVHFRDPAGKIRRKTIDPLIGGMARFEQGNVAGQEKLARGAAPTERDREASQYSITVRHADPFVGYDAARSFTVYGDLFKDAIYKGNKMNGKAKKLASMFYRRKGKNDFILWPNPEEVEQQTLRTGFEVPATGGNLSVEVLVGDNEAGSIQGVYSMQKLSQRKLGRLKRKLMGVLQRQLRIKRQGMGQEWSIENIDVLRATDQEGNRVQLTFLLPPSIAGSQPAAQLIDIEFAIPVRSYRAAAAREAFASGGGLVIPSDEEEPLQWKCDPRSLAQVTGLFMALEHVSAEFPDAGLQNHMKIINDHRKNLECDPSTTPSRIVNATIQQAVDDLWKIGGEMRVKKFTDKIVRLGANWAKDQAERLKEKMDTLRSTEGKLKKIVARARKKLVRREINDLQAAIIRAKLSPNMSKEAEKILDEALDALREAPRTEAPRTEAARQES